MVKPKRFSCLALLALLAYGSSAWAQASEAPQEVAAEATNDGQGQQEDLDKTEEQEQKNIDRALALTKDSKSGYVDTVEVGAGGGKTVSAELVDNDRIFDSVFSLDRLGDIRSRYYQFKKSFNERTGIAYNVDYSFLTTRASYSSTGDEEGASSVFRVYGAWNIFRDRSFKSTLIFKYEHRGAIWGSQTPRDLGFNTGSALSTANYKENGWGWTDMYAKVLSKGGRFGVLLGHMDPGDWADQHVLLNAWTNLLNDAFYNNSAEAIPKRTFSLVSRFNFTDNWYGGFGIHDSNGKDNHIDFRQVWDTPELFTWAEFGYQRPDAAFGESTHLHYWHQDQRVEAGVEESWGLAFSSSYVNKYHVKMILRLGYSEGDAAQMRRFVGTAVSFPARGSDRLLLGAGWGSPPDKSLGDQTVLELMYRVQVTQHIVVSPDLQVTLNPSFNDDKDVVYMYGLRFRFTF